MTTAPTLTPKQRRFVDEYLVDLCATQAAIRAGYSAKTAEVQGSRLLSNAKVAAAIAEGQRARSERTEITADAVLRQLWLVATADPNELVEYRRTCCRYCHGKDHFYQRTPAEMRRDRLVWEAGQTKTSKEVFDEMGGDGYNGRRPPHPDCPECFGDGEGRAHFKDTRKLSPSAKRLYLGVKIAKGGIETSMLNPMEALVHVGKHTGLFDAKPIVPEEDDAKIQRMRDSLCAMDTATVGVAA